MKIISDYHVHSSYSLDSEAPLIDMVNRAIDIGLEEIAFTEHIDLDYPGGYLFNVDYDTYIPEFNKLKETFKDRISMKLGVEVGLQPHVTKQMKEFINSYPFDFVLASTHIINKLDPYTGEFFENKTKEQAYEEYFKEILNTIINFNEFDCYGHLDYVIRYYHSEDKLYKYSEFIDILDEILKTLIVNNKGIEVNTSGYRKNLGNPHPQIEVLKRYKELGGEIITLGSDAHRPDELCYYFKEAYSLLQSIGFKYVTTFTKREPIFINLSK